MPKADDDVIVPSKELAQADSPMARLMEYAQSIQPEATEDVQERILRNILSAANPQDLFNAGGSIPAEQVLNMPMRVEAIRAAESSFDEGAAMYLHVDAKLLGNGDAVTFSTGAGDVVTKLLVADMNGWLPQNVVLFQASKPTKQGFYPIFVRALRDDEVPF